MRMLCLPVVSAFILGAAQPAVPSLQKLLDLVPDDAAAVMICPAPARLEAHWAKVGGHFGSQGRLLDLKESLGIDPSRAAGGALAKVFMADKGGHVWLLPTKTPEALLTGCHPIKKGGRWSWVVAPSAKNKKEGQAASDGKVTLYAIAQFGHLVIATREQDLELFRKPSGKLAGELALQLSGMADHDASFVVARAGVAEAFRGFKEVMQPKSAPKAEDGKSAAPAAPVPPPMKAVNDLKEKLGAWVEMAGASTQQALVTLDFTETGGVAFDLQLMLGKDSVLSRDLGKRQPVSGGLLEGMALADLSFAAASELNGPGDLLMLIARQVGAGKVQPATLDKVQQTLSRQSGLVRSWAGAFTAPLPRRAVLSGVVSMVRTTDAKAYLASMEPLAEAQEALFREGVDPDGAVSYMADILPGTPSCSMTIRFGGSNDAAMKMAILGMLAGGDGITLSMGALDDQRVLTVVGDASLLKVRLGEFKKSPKGLPPSIQALGDDLGGAPRLAFYFDPHGTCVLAQRVMQAFNPKMAKLPEIPAVPAAGISLSFDASSVHVKGVARGETLAATADLFKALDAIQHPKSEQEPGANSAEPPAQEAPAATPAPIQLEPGNPAKDQ
jgi:hypothetical protein